jgi:nicotinamidase/pyrazinamidase
MDLVSPKTILWEVDVQVDFMLPGGRLYILGAETIVGNISRLVEAARQGRILLISSADAHDRNDPEFREWPPHCLKGTTGAALLPEACASPRLVIPNRESFVVPENLGAYQQVILEKNTLDVFDNPHTDPLLERLYPAISAVLEPVPLFIVFGVATEYCVRLTVEGLLRRGRCVAIVTDAVRSIDEDKAQHILHNLHCRGARLIATQAALVLIAA